MEIGYSATEIRAELSISERTFQRYVQLGIIERPDKRGGPNARYPIDSIARARRARALVHDTRIRLCDLPDRPLWWKFDPRGSA